MVSGYFHFMKTVSVVYNFQDKGLSDVQLVNISNYLEVFVPNLHLKKLAYRLV